MQPGGVVYLTLRTAAPDRTAFAIRLATPPENHGKAQAYSVEADGVELCSEIYVDPGAGASRTISAELDTPARRVTVRIRAGWRNAFPITLESVRTYPAPVEADLTTASEPRIRMGLGLLTSKGYGYSIDRAELRAVAQRIPACEWFAPQAGVLYNFCTRSAADQLKAMREFGDMAVETRVPLRVLPQMHWAGIPAGVPDGAGGTFTDVPYQQITWDSNDQTDDPGLRPLLGDRYDVRYGLSVPNRWGNTPWLTFNHPRLNQYRRIRLREALNAWLTVRERMGRWGLTGLFPPELSTGEETVYWAKGVDDSAYTEFNGGKPRTALLADFNPFVVADALADRIALDPSDGLDRNERWWLHQNLSRWQETIVDWMMESVSPEPIKATDAGPVFADDLTRRNVFTEPYAMPVFPMRGVNPLRPGLEVGYVEDGRSGGEYWSGAVMLPWLIKERERGRIALPNLECTGADDGQLQACILAAYAHGARYVTLYNWHHRSNIRDILQTVAEAIQNGGSGLERTQVEPPESKGMAAQATFRGGPAAFGVNVLKAVANGGIAAGTVLRLGVRTLDEKPERQAWASVRIVSAAEGPVPIAARLPLMFSVRPGERYAVSVESISPPVAIAKGISGISALADVRSERLRSLAIEDRQDAEDILDSLDRRNREPCTNEEARSRLELARRLLEGGRALEAYRAAVRAEQLMFPSSFTVTEPGGTLRPFPVEVVCPEDRVRVTVNALTRELASVTVLSHSAQKVRIRYRGRATNVDLTPEVPVRVDVEARR
jgi:hypothetical protein